MSRLLGNKGTLYTPENGGRGEEVICGPSEEVLFEQRSGPIAETGASKKKKGGGGGGGGGVMQHWNICQLAVFASHTVQMNVLHVSKYLHQCPCKVPPPPHTHTCIHEHAYLYTHTHMHPRTTHTQHARTPQPASDLRHSLRGKASLDLVSTYKRSTIIMSHTLLRLGACNERPGDRNGKRTRVGVDVLLSIIDLEAAGLGVARRLGGKAACHSKQERDDQKP